MAKLLYGEPVAAKILARLKRETSPGMPGLAVVQVGKNKVSQKYIASKKEACEEIGLPFELYAFPQRISNAALRNEVEKIAKRKQCGGIIVQLPLPSSIRRQEVLDCVPVEKDVDVLSSHAFGFYALGTFPVLPPTVFGIAQLFRHYEIPFRDKTVLLLGMGRLVGLPTALWLAREKVTFSVATEKTKNIETLAKQADIIISGVGKSKLVKASMVKRGAVVLDVGTSVEQGRTVGDVDFNNVVAKAGAITPVPGGVGPLTVAGLLRNTIELGKVQKAGAP